MEPLTDARMKKSAKHEGKEYQAEAVETGRRRVAKVPCRSQPRSAQLFGNGKLGKDREQEPDVFFPQQLPPGKK